MGILDTSRCLSFVSFTIKTIAFVKKTKGNAFQIDWAYYEQRFHEYVLFQILSKYQFKK